MLKRTLTERQALFLLARGTMAVECEVGHGLDEVLAEVYKLLA